MKKVLTFAIVLTIAMTATSAMAATPLTSANFDSGLPNWTFVDLNDSGTPIGGGANVTTGNYDTSDTDTELYLNGTIYNPGDHTGVAQIGGMVDDWYALNMVVQAGINLDNAGNMDDMGIMARVQANFQNYGLIYDPNNKGIQLIYFSGSQYYNLGDKSNVVPPETITGTLRLMALDNANGNTLLVGQMLDLTTGAILAESQFRVGVDSPLDNDGEPLDPSLIAQISYGTAGVLAAVNSNGLGTTHGDTTIDTVMDDFAVYAALEGDFNMDGSVDVSDLGILATNYGTASGVMWSHGDANLDGGVDVSDLGVLATNYGQAASGVPAGAMIPEPATMSLLAVGGVLALIRRRK